MRNKCLYAFFDHDWTPRYIGSGRWERPTDHFYPSKQRGRERTPFYIWLRAEVAAGRQQKRLRLGKLL